MAWRLRLAALVGHFSLVPPFFTFYRGPSKRAVFDNSDAKGCISMEVRSIMTRHVEVVSSRASLKEAASKMRDLDVGLLPVCDGDRLQGILTDRDITVRATADGRDPNGTKVGDVMSTDIAYCMEDQGVDEAAGLMEARQIRRLPILNAEKRLWESSA